MHRSSPLDDPRSAPGAFARDAHAADAIPLVDEPLPDHSMRPLRTPEPKFAVGGARPDADAVPIFDGAPVGGGSRALDPSFVEADPAATWKRRPKPGPGAATHVRTFHARLTPEALAFMDQQINEWLDQHPECEVKLVSTAVGDWSGKIHEPHLICQIWV